MANLINYDGPDKWRKRVCELLNTVAAKITDVRRNNVSVVDDDGIANIEVPELGDSAENAYPGDKGKEAYDHSKLTSGNPHNVTARDLGLDTLQDQITALAEAIGTITYWESHTHGTLTDHALEPLQFRTTAKILEYH